MANRRQFLAGLLATGLIPKPTWADAGSPAFLSAAALPDETYVLCGISNERDVLFQIPLPDRGHAAAAHPIKPEAVAFARRPGTFAIVIDCTTGQPKATLSAPNGRHFYGHGCFSQDGNWLFTTENDYEAGNGKVGIWDVAKGYRRADEFDSGGVGPHDIKRLPGTDILVVANGGIETHPDTGRTKLNIPTMLPNLSYIDNGQIIEKMTLTSDFHKNSIRHLAVAPNGKVAFGMQWQGDNNVQTLTGFHMRGENAVLAFAPETEIRRMKGYVGSIAFSQDAKEIVVTSPRGGIVQIYDAESGAFNKTISLPDASGVTATPNGVLVSSGTGQLFDLTKDHAKAISGLRWDNHLISIHSAV